MLPTLVTNQRTKDFYSLVSLKVISVKAIRKMFSHNLSILILFIGIIYAITALQCVDHNNKPVDWFVLYKIPHIKKEKGNKLIKAGLAYAFMTSDSINPWKLSDLSIGSTQSIVGLTLQPLYDKNATDNIFILYNDQPPIGKENSNKGHTKGVVVGNKDGGFWLVHSVPHFPPSPENGSYSYPQTGTVYGQSFLCISVDSENLNTVGKQLQYNQPHLFAKNMPSDLLAFFPHLNDVINYEPIENPPWYSLQNVTSAKGYNFVSFAKSKNFGKELYMDWVSPTLTTDLWVETWLLGPGALPSKCGSPYSVLNIESINITSAEVLFHSTLDHSKWTVSSNDNNYWICIGDINREVSQAKRGGGTVCMFNKLIAASYKSLVNSTQPC